MLSVHLLAVGAMPHGFINDRKGTNAVNWPPTATEWIRSFPEIYKGKLEGLQVGSCLSRRCSFLPESTR